MAVTNLLKRQVDQPVFEWMRFSPITTAATNCLIGLNGQTGERYFYLIDFSNVNYQYDTYSDSWQQISSFTPVSTSGTVKGAATKSQGYEGIVLSATSTTIQTGGIGQTTKNAVGKRIRIASGKGAGQERTITAVSDVVIHDSGFSTTASTTAITDSVKKWRFNQWDGYSVRVQFNSSGSVLNATRKILYNSQTALTVSDNAYQMIDTLGNIPFNTSTPNTNPGSANLHYSIESVTLTVDSPWTDTPDSSSIFIILGGTVWFSSQLSTQLLLPQTYDVLNDTWNARTGIASSTHYGTALTSFPIALIDEATGAFVSGVTATSATARTLVNTGATMEYDRYANHQLRIVSGKGIGQSRRIVAHGATFMHIEKNWDIIPDNTSGYQIWGDTDKIYLCGNGTSSIYQYSIDGDCWAPGQVVDFGIARAISASPVTGTGVTYGPHHQGFAITSITRVTSGIVSGSVNAAGINYVVGDLVTCSTTGTSGTFFVTAVNDSGGVTALQLAASGSGYANGSSNTTGGSGSGLTITLTVGNTALVALPQSHDFVTGDSVGITGCATDTTFNGTFTVSVGAVNSFSISAPSSTNSPSAALAQSTTGIVDATKNWQTNEHTGKILILMTTAGTAPSIEARRITSNTATSITVASITTPTNGTTRYVICDVHALGAAQQYKVSNKRANGWVSSATATTLVDSTKSWDNNQWQACRVRIVAGTGLGNEVAISSNTATTLTVASWGVATPDATSKYEIMDTYGVATSGASSTINDTAKKWITNQFIGKRVKIVAGTGIGLEATITANTATQLTASGIGTPDSTSVYAIYEPLLRGVAVERFDWLFGLSDPAKKGRQIIQVGGANLQMANVDIYDIPSNTWNTNISTSPSAWSLSSGSMYAYDGADGYFGTVAATGRVFRLDIPTMTIESAGITPYAHGTALSRSGMQVLTTDDGLKYLYIQRHTGQEMWRTLKFW